VPAVRRDLSQLQARFAEDLDGAVDHPGLLVAAVGCRPTAVRLVASRYATHAVRAEPEIIERRIEEANAFARALADGWSKPSRSAITQRLRDRQTEDATGVLTLLLSDAADACDADAVLRGRIKAAADALR